MKDKIHLAMWNNDILNAETFLFVPLCDLESEVEGLNYMPIPKSDKITCEDCFKIRNTEDLWFGSWREWKEISNRGSKNQKPLETN